MAGWCGGWNARTEYLTEPPSDLPPAIAGVVVDERADLKEILATLLDLGRRGFLEIFELPEDYRFQLTGKSVPLRPFERVLVERLFRGHRVRRLSDWKHLCVLEWPSRFWVD